MLDIYINDNLRNSIKLLSQKEDLKISTILIATFNILSQRYSGQENIIFDQSLIAEENIKYADNKFNVKSFKTQLNSRTRFTDFLKNQQLSLSEATNFTSLKTENSK